MGDIDGDEKPRRKKFGGRFRRKMGAEDDESTVAGGDNKENEGEGKVSEEGDRTTEAEEGGASGGGGSVGRRNRLSEGEEKVGAEHGHERTNVEGKEKESEEKEEGEGKRRIKGSGFRRRADRSSSGHGDEAGIDADRGSIADVDADENDPLQPQAHAPPELTGITNLLVSCFQLRSDMWFKMGYSMNSEALLLKSESKSSFSRDNIKNWCLGIRIGGLSSLHSELGMVRPFVRIHAVDLQTGQYLHVKQGQPLLPVATKSCFLNTVTTVPNWEEEILLDAPLSSFINTSTVLLFEILDVRTPLNTKSNKPRQSTTQRLAWAFLRPVGENNVVNFGYPREWRQSVGGSIGGGDGDSPRGDRARGREESNDREVDAEEKDEATVEKKSPLNVDALHTLQLYEYQTDGPLEALQRRVQGWSDFTASIPQSSAHPNTNEVPEPYVQWRRRVLNKLAGVLSIQIGTRMSLQEVKRRESLHLQPVGAAEEMLAADREPEGAEDPALAKLRVSVMKIARDAGEPCSIPNKLLHRISVGPEGAIALSFSHSGNMLAVASLTADASSSHFVTGATTYALRIYCPNRGVELWSDMIAHHGVIYEIKWGKKDNYIVTCSGDGTSKVWNIGVINKSTASGIVIPNQALIRADLLHRVAIHQPPVFIYTVAIIEGPVSVNLNEDLPSFLTGSFDGRIRVWKGDVMTGQLLIAGNQDQPPHLGAVHSIVIDERTRHLFTGDSTGVVLVWRLDSSGTYQLLRKFRRDDLEGKNIMSLQIHPDRTKAQMLVFAEPSILRVYTLNNYKAHCSYPGVYVTGSFSRACLSADGRYVISGSEDSRSNTTKGESTSIYTSSSSRPSRLKVWDSESGSLVNCPLSDIPLPYSVRCTSWNPNQHMIAVAMVGQGASVAIYTAEKVSALKALEIQQQTTLADLMQMTMGVTADEGEMPGSPGKSAGSVEFDTRPSLANRAVAKSGRESPTGPDMTVEERKAKTAAIMAKMRERRQKNMSQSMS